MRQRDELRADVLFQRAAAQSRTGGELVPNLVGSSLPDARQRTKKLRLAVRVRYTAGSPSSTVLRQSLEPGIAVRPGLPITLLVGDGSTS